MLHPGPLRDDAVDPVSWTVVYRYGETLHVTPFALIPNTDLLEAAAQFFMASGLDPKEAVTFVDPKGLEFVVNWMEQTIEPPYFLTVSREDAWTVVIDEPDQPFRYHHAATEAQARTYILARVLGSGAAPAEYQVLPPGEIPR